MILARKYKSNIETIRLKVLRKVKTALQTAYIQKDDVRNEKKNL